MHFYIGQNIRQNGSETKVSSKKRIDFTNNDEGTVIQLHKECGVGIDCHSKFLQISVIVKAGKEFKKDTEKDMYLKCNLFQTSLDYLTEMTLLSSCDALIGSITSGFRYAVMKGINNIKHLEIVNCGIIDMSKQDKR